MTRLRRATAWQENDEESGWRITRIQIQKIPRTPKLIGVNLRDSGQICFLSYLCLFVSIRG